MQSRSLHFGSGSRREEPCSNGLLRGGFNVCLPLVLPPVLLLLGLSLVTENGVLLCNVLGGPVLITPNDLSCSILLSVLWFTTEGYLNVDCTLRDDPPE